MLFLIRPAGGREPEGLKMLSIHGSKEEAAPTPASPPAALPAAAAKAVGVARLILAGELDLETASARSKIAVPVLEAWLRALLASGLVRSSSRER